jgi:tyrosyl-tRNA synthetase
MVQTLSKEVPFVETSVAMPSGIADLLALAGACKSKGEARRLIKGGGLYLNGNRITAEDYSISEEDLLHGGFLFFRLGKKRFFMVKCL